MKIDQDASEIISRESRILCHHHGAEAPTIARLVTEFLESDRIVNFQRQGRHSFQPGGTTGRNIYAATREDGAEIKFAFTGMQTIMFLGKRNRTSHLYPADAREKFKKFLEAR